MKKIVFILSVLCLGLVFSSCQKNVSSKDFECNYDENKKGVVITKYLKDEEEVTIPGKISGYPVVEISRGAFKNKYETKKITVSSNVKTICASAFEYCISLEEITLPDTLEEIGIAAFSQCRSLSEISIPSGVAKIGLCAFGNCNQLYSIDVDPENEYYSSDDDGILFDKDKTELILFPSGLEMRSYEIPQSVVKIADYAFENSSYLTDITLSDKTEKIGDYAFSNTKISSLVLPDTVKEIGKFCFENSHFHSVELGKGLSEISESAFNWCVSLEQISIPGNIEKIAPMAFYHCSGLKKVETEKEYPAEMLEKAFNDCPKDIEFIINT